VAVPEDNTVCTSEGCHPLAHFSSKIAQAVMRERLGVTEEDETARLVSDTDGTLSYKDYEERQDIRKP
jgi:hypothetical protein